MCFVAIIAGAIDRERLIKKVRKNEEDYRKWKRLYEKHLLKEKASIRQQVEEQVKMILMTSKREDVQ